MSLFRAISARIYAVVIFCQLTMMKCRERMIQGLCALATFLLPGMAFAEGDLADMLSSAAAGAKSGKTSGTEIARAIEYSSSSVPCWLSKKLVPTRRSPWAAAVQVWLLAVCWPLSLKL